MDRYLSYSAAVSSIVFLLFIALLAGSPAQSFEPNLYLAVSPAAWVLFAFWFAIISVLSWLCIENHPAIAPKAVSLVALQWFAGSAIFLSIPLMRYSSIFGFYDAWIHAGAALQISGTGIVDLRNDVYPLAHILCAQIALLTGLPMSSILGVLVATLHSMRIPLILIAVRKITKDYRVQLVATMASALPSSSFGVSFAPFYVSAFLLLMMIPLLLNPARSWRQGLCLAILTIAVTVSHIIVALALFGGLLAASVAARGIISRTESAPKRRKDSRWHFSLSVTTITIIVSWLVLASGSYQEIVPAAVRGITEGGVTASSAVASARPWTQFVLEHVTTFVVLGPAALAFAGSIVRARRPGNQKIPPIILALAFSFFAYFVLFVLVLGNQLAQRFFWLAYYVGPLFFVGFRGPRIAGIRFRNKGIPVMLVVFIVAFPAGMVSAYPSPFTSYGNMQSTQAQLAAAQWLAPRVGPEPWILTGTQGVGIFYGSYFYAYPQEDFWLAFVGSRYALAILTGHAAPTPGAHRDLPFTVSNNPYHEANTTNTYIFWHSSMAYIFDTSTDGAPETIPRDRLRALESSGEWQLIYTNGDSMIFLKGPEA